MTLHRSGIALLAAIALSACTGIVPRGTITRVLEPGSYVFVLDNRSGNEPILLTEVDVRME